MSKFRWENMSTEIINTGNSHEGVLCRLASLVEGSLHRTVLERRVGEAFTLPL